MKFDCDEKNEMHWENRWPMWIFVKEVLFPFDNNFDRMNEVEKSALKLCISTRAEIYWKIKKLFCMCKAKRKRKEIKSVSSVKNNFVLFMSEFWSICLHRFKLVCVASAKTSRTTDLLSVRTKR